MFVKDTRSILKDLDKENTIKHSIAILIQYIIACEKHNYIDEYHSEYSPFESKIEKGPLDRNDPENHIIFSKIVELRSKFEKAKFPFNLEFSDFVSESEYNKDNSMDNLKFLILRTEIKLPDYIFGKKKQIPKIHSNVLNSLLTIKKKPNKNKKKLLGPINSELPGTATAPGRFRIRFRK